MVVVRDVRVLSRVSVRATSADLRVVVSVVSWSIKAKARVKEASIWDLSISSWGGVGGVIRGRM